MRIAHIMAGAPIGGAELFFERLCIAQHSAGEAVLPIIRRDPARAARLAAAGLAPAQLRFGGALDPFTGPQLGRLLRAHAPAVAVAWMGRAASHTPRGPWTLVGRLGGYYDLKRFRHCAHLAANTQHIAAWIVGQGIPPGRVHHVPNFVPDLHGAAPAGRAAIGVPATAPLLLALGRLHPVKGFDVLIRALATLPAAHAVIAGEGLERARLTRLAAELGLADRVHLPGWRTDIANLLAAADVFVCPSRHEPLGNAVLEAWSASRPVIATAAQGPAALIRHGETGLLSPIDQPEPLADAIRACLADPAYAAALAQAGRARYLAAFAEPAVVAQWRGFLGSVAP
jgi:glycosyltransferase involved in cell wall biosynthesis